MASNQSKMRNQKWFRPWAILSAIWALIITSFGVWLWVEERSLKEEDFGCIAEISDPLWSQKLDDCLAEIEPGSDRPMVATVYRRDDSFMAVYGCYIFLLIVAAAPTLGSLFVFLFVGWLARGAKGGSPS